MGIREVKLEKPKPETKKSAATAILVCCGVDTLEVIILLFMKNANVGVEYGNELSAELFFVYLNR